MFKISDFDWSIKSVAEDGTFSGHGSVFGNIDRVNDVVVRGAFSKSLAARTNPIPILWMHRKDEPIGVFTRAEEDDKGLYVEGVLLVDEVARAKEAYALMRAKAVTGLSIGYFIKNSWVDPVTGVNYLNELQVEEVSVVSFPANDEARIDTVKSLLAKGGVPTIRDMENVLRDLGFSKSQAVAVASHGHKGLRDADEASNLDLSALIAQVSSFKL
ncbi:HK97 family phage prohead protease [Pararhizobium gei]|uniref:HK97 family phage prohead protease n=1 Tax=Pararhizobium gei TaxID=1395951 RepID=UPI0023DA1D5B|nr:HK97 family phage prohead protease [Rhizobium gei]